MGGRAFEGKSNARPSLMIGTLASSRRKYAQERIARSETIHLTMRLPPPLPFLRTKALELVGSTVRVRDLNVLPPSLVTSQLPASANTWTGSLPSPAGEYSTSPSAVPEDTLLENFAYTFMTLPAGSAGTFQTTTPFPVAVAVKSPGRLVGA